MKYIILLFLLPQVVYAQFLFRQEVNIPIKKNQKDILNPWAGGLNTPQWNEMDLNFDGEKDLVIFDRTANKLVTFLNHKNQWKYAPEYEDLFPENISPWILLKDYDGDGLSDIFTQGTSGIKVYKNMSSQQQISWQLVADPIYSEGFDDLINLQINSTDIPAISDLDGDGDLDILVFDFANGTFIHYHKNLSIENYGNKDFLVFKRITNAWGEFRECDCNDFAFNNEACQEGGKINLQNKIQHLGGKSLLTIDLDGDSDKELLLGHEECSELYQFTNTGTPDEAKITSFTNTFPNPQNPANFHIFPTAFWLDLDFDNIKDLIISSNASQNIDDKIDFKNSGYLYKNVGTNNAPEFQYLKNNFLQEEMIDLGEYSAPVLTDFDQDGDLDLLVGNRGSLIEDSFRASLAFFENIGSANSPSFELIDTDFLNLSALNITYLFPSFTDIDEDGVLDLIFTGRTNDDNILNIHYIINKASTGEAFKYTSEDVQILPFNIGLNDYVYFYDVNSDGKPDLLVGRSSGRIEYYLNTGGAPPNFVLENNTFLNITDDFSKRSPIPLITEANNDGLLDMIVIDQSQQITIYEDFKASGNTKPYNDIIFNPLTEDKITKAWGKHIKLASGDLFANGLTDIIMGNAQGGLFLLKNISDQQIAFNDNIRLQVFPNPAHASHAIKVLSNEDAFLTIYTSTGKQITDNVVLKAKEITILDGNYLQAGVYILKAHNSKSKSAYQKILVF